MSSAVVVLTGGALDVVIAARGACVLSPRGTAALREHRATPDEPLHQLHRRLVGDALLDPARATAAVARLRHAGAVSSDPAGAGEATGELIVEELVWSSFSMPPAQVAELARAVINDRPRTVVEFGAGVSTVAMTAAANVAGLPTTVASFEEDGRWSASLAAPLAAVTAPGTIATITVCPLHPWPRREPFPVQRWFDPEVVAQVLDGLGAPIDLLVVDGPTAYRPQWRYDRYPALPTARKHLAPTARILLDDTQRDGEAEVAARWRAELGARWLTAPGPRSTWFRGQA